jgi:glutamyl-Q tRNA(Asp) synthetase
LKKKPSPSDSGYRGRFAPSPTGPLHFGSLVTAVGSYLDAKHRHGTWLVRMEDLDLPRCSQDAADNILFTLEAFGLHSDEPVIYQSRRTSSYEQALQELRASGAAYPCGCTRKETADSALHGLEGPIYPGTCRNGIADGRAGRSWRVHTHNDPITFNDSLQGPVSQRLESEIGDFVVKRADGLFAYQLAVVVDDAWQDITHVVRGADLLDSTPRQIWLQRLLGLHTPQYMHLPVAVNDAGEKLSKQTLAAPVDEAHPARTLLQALTFLRQSPPAGLAGSNVATILDWAVQNWNVADLRGIRTLPASLSAASSLRDDAAGTEASPE